MFVLLINHFPAIRPMCTIVSISSLMCCPYNWRTGTKHNSNQEIEQSDVIASFSLNELNQAGLVISLIFSHSGRSPQVVHPKCIVVYISSNLILSVT